MSDKSKKNEKISDFYARMGVHTTALYHRGVSLRLLGALMGTGNYSTIYGHLIAHDPEIPRINRRHPPQWEQSLYAKWCELFPAELSAMVEKQITLRKWCAFHGITNDGNADISAIIDKTVVGMNYGCDIELLLGEDFPLLSPVHKRMYWAKEINPDLYYRRAETHIKGKKTHIFTNNELGIKVIHRSLTTGFAIFSGRLRIEISIRRLQVLTSSDQINDESINKALGWLPERISERRTMPAANTSPVHKMLREKERASADRAKARGVQ